MPFLTPRCQSKRVGPQFCHELCVFQTWPFTCVFPQHSGWPQQWCSTGGRCVRRVTCSRPGTPWRRWRPERTSDTSTPSRGSTSACWRANGWRRRRVSEARSSTVFVLCYLCIVWRLTTELKYVIFDEWHHSHSLQFWAAQSMVTSHKVGNIHPDWRF